MSRLRSLLRYPTLVALALAFGHAAHGQSEPSRATPPVTLPDPWSNEGAWENFYPASEAFSLRSPIFPAYEEEAALSPHEPMYAAIGGTGGIDARFQISFKYRVFDADSALARAFTPMRHFYLAYTQTSLWALSEHSKPFKDTSYRPSAFWQLRLPQQQPWLPQMVRFGYEHESNGKGEPQSRSIDTLILQPIWRTVTHDRELVFAPKAYVYLEKEDNPDIQRYRGYVDWNVRYGTESSWLVAATLRASVHGRGSVQLDVSYPLRQPFFYRAGGYFYAQLFHGYGESMLDYNREHGPSLRVGLAIVR